MTLTDRQAEIVGVIRGYWHDHGRPPAVRELCGLLGIGSPNGLTCHLRALARKGAIEWERTATARGIWPAGLRQRIRELAWETT